MGTGESASARFDVADALSTNRFLSLEVVRRRRRVLSDIRDSRISFGEVLWERPWQRYEPNAETLKGSNAEVNGDGCPRPRSGENRTVSAWEDMRPLHPSHYSDVKSSDPPLGAGFGDEAIETFAVGLRSLGADHPPRGQTAITGRLALEEFPGSGVATELALVGVG
jgi:hypothetical protein